MNNYDYSKNDILNFTKEKMNKIIFSFKNELSKINIGKSNPDILSNLTINYYGKIIKINKISNIYSSDLYQLTIKPYDSSIISLIINSINKSELNFSTLIENNLIKVNIPQITEERRKLIIKNMLKEVEKFKIFIRNERRQANENIKNNKDFTKDDKKKYESEIQKITNCFIKEIDDLSKIKQNDLLKI